MNFDTMPVPHDAQSRAYFDDTEVEQTYEERIQEEINLLIRELAPLTEEISEGVAMEPRETVLASIDDVRSKATRILSICDEINEIERYGI